MRVLELYMRGDALRFAVLFTGRRCIYCQCLTDGANWETVSIRTYFYL